MPSRADNIFNRYARAVVAQEMIAQSLQDYASAEERAQYLETLAANERATLSALEESFAVPPVDLGSAGQTLQEQYAVQRAEQSAAAAARASRTLNATQRAAIEQQNRDGALQALTELTADPSVTAEELSEARRLFNARHTPLTQREAGFLQQAEPPQRAQALAARPGELTAAERGTEQALQALYFAGPQGIYGGFEGEAEITQRRNRQAPRGSRFTSGEDAFNVYLRLLDDGSATAEELARELGHESAQAAAADFAFAKAQYDNARAVGAFTNDQRKYFEQRWLDTAAQSRQLQERAERARARVPEDPRRAAIRAELVRRGVDVDDPYLQYQGTPLHGILTEADRLYQSGQVSAGEDKDLMKVEELLRQYEKTGTRWTVDALEQQLRKTLDGEDLQGALSYALAWQRQQNEGAAGTDSRVPLAERKPAPAPEPEPVSDDAFLMERNRLDDLRREQQRIEAELRAQAQQQARTPAPRPQPTPEPEPEPSPPAALAQPAAPPAQPAPPAAPGRQAQQAAMSPMVSALGLPSVQVQAPAPTPAALDVSPTEAQRAAAQQSEVIRQAIIDKIEAAVLADDYQEAERLRGFLP